MWMPPTLATTRENVAGGGGALPWPTDASHTDGTDVSAFPTTGWSQALEDITVLTLPLILSIPDRDLPAETDQAHWQERTPCVCNFMTTAKELS